jgi:transcriptional regulator with XRE-family HTH domain
MKDLNAPKHADFGLRFRTACQLIDKDNLPQDELGKLFNVSGPMISYYRTGQKLPSMETACFIAEKTNVSLEWLMLGRGNMVAAGNQDSTSLSSLWGTLSDEERTAFLAGLASNNIK